MIAAGHTDAMATSNSDTSASQMRAVQFSTFGPPSVLQLRADYPKPICTSKEVLIRIHAASVNPVDIAIRQGNFMALMTKKPNVLGSDLSGVIENANGSQKFKQGDRVFAMTDGANVRNTKGTYAEYIAIPEADVALMPASLGFEAAAGVPLTALTAWQALEKGAFKAGQRVLIQAGSGGVGSWLVQLAKSRGLHVTATCSTPNIDYCKKELGADDVIDYTQQKLQDACKGRDKFDGVIDCVGGQTESDSYACLSSKGSFVEILNPNMSKITLASHLSRGMLGLGPRYSVVFATSNGEWLQQVADLIQSGKGIAPVDRVFLLEETAKAHEYFEARKQTRGKVILQVHA